MGSSQDAIDISLKYQVLSQKTQFIGVVRNMKQQVFDVDSDEQQTIVEIATVRARLPKQLFDPDALYDQHVGIFLSGMKRQHS